MSGVFYRVLFKFVFCNKTGAVFLLSTKINPAFIQPSPNDFHHANVFLCLDYVADFFGNDFN